MCSRDHMTLVGVSEEALQFNITLLPLTTVCLIIPSVCALAYSENVPDPPRVDPCHSNSVLCPRIQVCECGGVEVWVIWSHPMHCLSSSGEGELNVPPNGRVSGVSHEGRVLCMY